MCASLCSHMIGQSILTEKTHAAVACAVESLPAGIPTAEGDKRPAGSFLLFLIIALVFAGCAQTQDRLKDLNRDYDAFGDMSEGTIGISGRWYPAPTPGTGRPSVGLKLQGKIPVGTQLSPDFKSGPKATTKGIWF